MQKYSRGRDRIIYREVGIRLIVLCTISNTAAQADNTPQNIQSPASTTIEPTPSQTATPNGLFDPARANLLGGLFGIRDRLQALGINLTLSETSEVFGNISGGLHRGAAYDGAALAGLSLDTSKLLGLDGGVVNVSAYQIHGRNLSSDNLGTIQTASGIEADRAARLWEAWFQQNLAGNTCSVRLGLQSVDQEFLTSAGSALFINTAMGWPAVPSSALYAGGPAYPLSSLGVRVRAQTQTFVFLAGVFDDSPSGGGFAEASQLRGAIQSGTKFNLDSGSLTIAELQYTLNLSTLRKLSPSPASADLTGTYKLGFWYDTQAFPDRRHAAAPSARFHRGDWSVYTVVDQMLWQPSNDSPRTVGVFFRGMLSPSDRNLVDRSINAGLTLKAPFHGRDNDNIGVGFGLATIASLPNQRPPGGDSSPLGAGRTNESFVEITYQISLAPWLVLQPDGQYVFIPGGGVPSPCCPSRRLANEAVWGIRTAVAF